MRSIPRTGLLLLLAIAGPLCAQGEETPDEQRQRIVKMLTETPEARAARNREFRKQTLLAQMPGDSPSALLVMPVIGDVVRLAFNHCNLELHRGAKPCGSCFNPMPGQFTARAFGPHQILVAMDSTNARTQTMIVCLTRPGAASDFELSAQVIVDQVTNDLGGAPMNSSVVAWDAATRIATLVFAWAGINRVVVGDVELASTTPAEPAAGRFAALPSRRAVQIDAQAVGIGAEVIDADGELHMFVRQRTDLGRAAPVRVSVRDRSGKWSQPKADAADVLVEPEFTVFRDAAGVVHLTTPVSDVFGLAEGQTPQVVQTLRTFRMDKDTSRWTLAPTQFEWSGQLRLGQQLRIAMADRTPAVVLQTVAGEVVERRLGAPEPARGR